MEIWDRDIPHTHTYTHIMHTHTHTHMHTHAHTCTHTHDANFQNKRKMRSALTEWPWYENASIHKKYKQNYEVILKKYELLATLNKLTTKLKGLCS